MTHSGISLTALLSLAVLAAGCGDGLPQAARSVCGSATAALVAADAGARSEEANAQIALQAVEGQISLIEQAADDVTDDELGRQARAAVEAASAQDMAATGDALRAIGVRCDELGYQP